MSELKPCPFCGGEAEIERAGNGRYSTIYRCTWCGCSLETSEEFNHGTAWNSRPAENKIKAEGVREALKALDNRQKYSDRFLNGRQYLEEYANKLEKGDA